MIIIPAIDIQDGSVVRFVQGKLDKKVYSHDPLETARHWLAQGAKQLHIVDLNGAESGVPVNLAIVREIVKNIPLPVQFGGGVRSLEIIEDLLAFGVNRVVLGTKAMQDKAFLKQAFERFGDKIIVSLDARDNKVLIKGWDAQLEGLDVLTAIKVLKEIGFTSFIYTDISKDGALKGPNLEGIKDLLQKSGLKIIGSGGVSSLDDIRNLKLMEKYGLIGIIVGKALYEGRFTLAEALKLA